jgi:hypothetical protein
MIMMTIEITMAKRGRLMKKCEIFMSGVQEGSVYAVAGFN